MIRRILNGQKTEEEIYEIYQEPTIDADVKSRRLQLLRHIERIIGDRTAWKIAYKRKTKETLEKVTSNLGETQVKNWKSKARNRKLWKKVTNIVLYMHSSLLLESHLKAALHVMTNWFSELSLCTSSILKFNAELVA